MKRMSDFIKDPVIVWNSVLGVNGQAPHVELLLNDRELNPKVEKGQEKNEAPVPPPPTQG